ncbi:MAG: hypothetical protein KatS3mg012_0588 [Gaiellaceae bacterium]|jgi:hypothetical protein|nr:MAG: hypothetical protein KatS3mg012_0588 [Gaiellaceae bacterium]
MLLAPLPFDYATLLDPGDRVRRTRIRTEDRRVRPTRARGSRP